MRIFLTLCSLAAVAFAKPQGYNYGTGVSGVLTGTTGHSGSLGGSGFLTAPSITHTSSGSGGLTGGYTGGLTSGPTSGYNSGNSGFVSYSGPSTIQQTTTTSNVGGLAPGFGSSSYSTGGLGGIGGISGLSGLGGLGGHGGLQSVKTNFQSSTGSSSGYVQQQSHLQAPIIHKQFFTIAAEEDNESLERSKHLVLGRPQKNYRIVFIKAPSSSSANVRLSAEYAPKEEKTVIYVLTKKDSSLEVNDIATPAPTVPSKPDVFFIKYKTEAEAQHAQQQIQAEYDKIQGTSEHTDGGVVHTQSVVGILDGGHGDASIGSNYVQNIGSVDTISSGGGLDGVGTLGTIGKISTIRTATDQSSGSTDYSGVSEGATYLPPDQK